jgi:hypothetical protein
MTDPIDITAVLERVRKKYEYVAYQTLIATDDRDAILAHIDAQAARIAELEREKAEAIADATSIAETNLHAAAHIEGQAFAAGVLRERIAALEGALKPSAETKIAYWGEFKFTTSYVGLSGNDGVDTHVVPWTTVKAIMAAIRARALRTAKDKTNDL